MNAFRTVERLVLIRLAYSVVFHGVDDRDAPDMRALLAKLDTAGDDEIRHLSRPEQEAKRRHAARATEQILAPFIEQGMSCAKFGLSVFYAINILAEEGLYDIGQNPMFEEAMSAIISEDGTVTEFANIERLDKSAQKNTRRILTALNSLGYFVKQREQAA